MAKVGQHADAAVCGFHVKANRILRVVRHREVFDHNVANLERLAGDELADVEPGLHLETHLVGGESVAVNRNLEPGAERLESLRVVGMLVGEQDAVERLGRAAQLGQSQADLTAAEAGVDQQPRLLCFKIGGISPGTAP